jgi:hypothetical protein
MAKESLKDRLAKKRKKLKDTGSGKMLFIKADTVMRVRVLPVGDENEFVKEVTQFYLGGDIKGVFSPVTIGEPCAIMEAYNELKSGDEDEKDIAKTMIPKTKYLMPVVVYEDLKGSKINKDRSGKLVQLTRGLYQSILDLYLDDDEWGDMTDVKNGYDIKLSREGSGMTDTEYSVKPCKNTPLDKAWRKQVDLDEMVAKVIPTYEETEENIQDFLGLEKKPSDKGKDKPEKKSKKVKSKKKKRKSDI